MKQTVIQIENIFKYPPTLSLLTILSKLGEEVTLLTSFIDEDIREFCSSKNISVIRIGKEYNLKASTLSKGLRIPGIRIDLNKYLRSNSTDLFWIMTSTTLKSIGNSLLGYKYILYMYELYDNLVYTKYFPWLKVNLYKLFKNSRAVIECELNRAYITQAQFGLDKLPYVIQNKPILENESQYSKMMNISREDLNWIAHELVDKTVILYQGIIDEERPIHYISKAVEELGESYIFLVMSDQIDNMKYIGKNTVVVPFVKPPKHLEVTSWADIGVLIYTINLESETSKLNSIYCAPNKIFEYSMFDIPMIGNRIPGLINTIENNGIGKCFNDFESETIKQAILSIVSNKKSFRGKPFSYYQSVDNLRIFKQILSDLYEDEKIHHD